MAALKKPCRTIYEALLTLTVSLYIFGYSRFYKRGDRFQATKAMFFYSVSMPIFISLGLIMGAFFVRTSPKYVQYFEDMDTLLVFIVSGEIAMAVLSFVLNITSLQRKNANHLNIFLHLEQLDNKLVREFNANMCYEKIHFKTSLIVWIFFLYYILVTVLVVRYWSQGDLIIVSLMFFCHSFIIAGMHMVVYSFMTVADVLRIRFRLLQKLLAPAFLRSQFVDQDVRVFKLSKAIEIYRELYEVIDELNDVYGFCLLSCLAHDFTLATSLFYLMFGRSSKLGSAGGSKLFFGVFMVLLPPAYKMFMMPVYCAMSMNEGKKCMRIIKVMDDAFPGDSRVRQIVGAALLWNNHNKRQYKIGPMITSNVGLITMVMSAIMNYVVILIQFQIQEEVLRV